MRGVVSICLATLLVGGARIARAQFPPDEGFEEAVPPDAQAGYPGEAPTVDDFYVLLSPHGQWLDDPTLGAVWQPSPGEVGVGFTPYAGDGQWVDTPDGWEFDTPYDWLNATFHYGRWFRSPVYGWLWYPGTDWAPSWVDWRYGNGYVGIAPLPPEELAEAYSLPWFFVEAPYFTAPDFGVHVIWDPARVDRYLASTQPVYVSHGERWRRGPDVNVLRRSGAHVEVRPSDRSRWMMQQPGGSRMHPPSAVGRRPTPPSSPSHLPNRPTNTAPHPAQPSRPFVIPAPGHAPTQGRLPPAMSHPAAPLAPTVPAPHPAAPHMTAPALRPPTPHVAAPHPAAPAARPGHR